MYNKLLLPASLLTLTACNQVEAESESTEKRPNIILFMVDDMGWQDTSLPFWTEKTPLNRLYETPNMERLAAQGMLFTQAYASSVSSPTRCSLLTGANAARHRVTNWTLQKNRPTDRKSEVLEFPEWNVNGVSQTPGIERTFHATSFVQLLKDNGYHTIHCGKAHFGAIDTPGENPTHFGFEVNIAGHAAGGLASYLGEESFGNHTDERKPQPPFAIPGLEKYHGQDIFVTEALTIEATKALNKAKKYGQPFFLYMSHYAIHTPIQKDMRFYQKYVDKGMTPTEAAYASMIEGMDKSLGDLMDWLTTNDEAENTVILFMSDNGGLAASNRTPPLHIQNAPLNSGKGSAYEGGIREPMIVAWPGVVAPRTKCDDYLIIEDFYPTILEIAGIRKYETVQPIDGISFVPLLTRNDIGQSLRNDSEKAMAKSDEKNTVQNAQNARKTSGKASGKTAAKGLNLADGRALYWNFPNQWGSPGPGIGSSCTIRDGDWKLIYYYETGEKELFNIPEDIGERNNQATHHPETVKRLSKKLSDYLRSVRAQRPSFKATGKLCPWPDE